MKIGLYLSGTERSPLTMAELFLLLDENAEQISGVGIDLEAVRRFVTGLEIHQTDRVIGSIGRPPRES